MQTVRGETLDPVAAAAARARLGADPFAVRGIRSALIGRDEELGRLRETVQRAVDFQAPQLVTVIGNQGTGKSRLVDELVQNLGPNIRAFRGCATPSAGRYSAIESLLSERFGITESTPDAVARDEFRRQVQEVFGDQRVGEVLHFLGQFLDLPFPDSPFLQVLGESPEQREEITRTVLRRFIEVDADQSPLVLVFDDVQWADDASLDLLRHVGSSLGGSPVVLIIVARPDLMVRLSDWGGDETDHLRIDLRNLEPQLARGMFESLLSRCGGVPEEIVDDAVEMTGGNPHFLVQLVRLFLDNGTIDSASTPWHLDAGRASETELPISVEEAIEARIAALEAHERDLLEKGAIFGNVFWVGAIVALTRLEEAAGASEIPPPAPAGPLDYDWTDSGESIRRRVLEIVDNLVERDYILKLDLDDSTIIGDVELVFKHNLERELIARGTDLRRLERHHRMAAQWLELKLAARSDEQLEFLAQLYERGGDRRRAAQCFVAGGDKARDRYANEQAVELYKRGLAMLGPDDAAVELDALHNLGSVLDRVGRTTEAQTQFTLMLRKAWLLDHRAKGAAAHSRLGRVHRRLGEYDAAMAHLRASHDLFKQAGDRRGVAGALDDIGQIHWIRGAYGQALEFHRQALAIRRALGDRRSIALCLANIGRVHRDSGAFKAATRQVREALELRREIGDLSGVVESLCDLAGVHADDGQVELALEMFREARRTAEEIGDRLALAHVLSGYGQALASDGRHPDAVEVLLEGTSLATELGDRVGRAECSTRLAEVFLKMGDATQAFDQAHRALEISRSIGSRAQVGTAHRVLAEAIASSSDALTDRARAEEHFRKAIEILAAMKHELELARCYRVFADFRARCGNPAEAEKLRKLAEEIFGRLRGASE